MVDSLEEPATLATSKKLVARREESSILSKVRQIVLLGGAVRLPPLAAATRRAILDLPVHHGRSLLDHWVAKILSMVRELGMEDLVVRVLACHSLPLPALSRAAAELNLRLEQDGFDYRGTGGILRELSSRFDDEDYLLVLNANQLFVQSLSDIVLALAQRGGDVCLVSHADGTPTGIKLVRCGTLRGISSVGYVDFREQLLPRIAKSYSVRVLELEEPSGLPIRTFEDYLEVLRVFHLRNGHQDGTEDPFAEEWQSTFTLVESGATVEEGAQLHDAVVLRGGCVKRGAFVARSVVCEGGIVHRNHRVLNRLVV